MKLSVSAYTLYGLWRRPPVKVTYENFQYIWNVYLMEIDTGVEIDKTIIEGDMPKGLSSDTVDLRTFDYFGSKPDFEDLVDWLEAVME